MKFTALLLVYIALVALLAITVGAALLPIDRSIKPVVGLVVAAAKAGLIASVFMELRNRGGMVRVFAAAGFFWLVLMFVLTGADYLTRGWH
jgi:cytochrome c oxidase subunit 4